MDFFDGRRYMIEILLIRNNTNQSINQSINQASKQVSNFWCSFLSKWGYHSAIIFLSLRFIWKVVIASRYTCCKFYVIIGCNCCRLSSASNIFKVFWTYFSNIPTNRPVRQLIILKFFIDIADRMMDVFLLSDNESINCTTQWCIYDFVFIQKLKNDSFATICLNI